MSQTITNWIHIVSHPWFIPQYVMTGDYSSHFITMKLLQLVNRTLQELAWQNSIRLQDTPDWGWWWTSHWIQSPHHTIWSCLIMEPHCQFQRWPCQNKHIAPPSAISPDRTQKSHLSGMATTMKDSMYNLLMWFIVSAISHINKKHQDWGIPLPNITTTWYGLCIEVILLPGHVKKDLKGKSIVRS